MLSSSETSGSDEYPRIAHESAVVLSMKCSTGMSGERVWGMQERPQASQTGLGPPTLGGRYTWGQPSGAQGEVKGGGE